MVNPTRRGFLTASAAIGVAAGVSAPASANMKPVAADIARYLSFGHKQSGGPGDIASGDWLADELRRSGYTVERTRLSAPFFDVARSDVSIAGQLIEIWPQPVVRTTPLDGMTGPLVRVSAGGLADMPLAGAIALIDLPYGRWSSLTAKAIRGPVAKAFLGGAQAALVITNGPTGKVTALNADGREPMFPGPVGLVAPINAAPLLAAAAARTAATVTITGSGGRREVFNVVGRLDRGRSDWVVISTPRSGWFDCAGERGGGIAAWLDLARWSPAALPDHNLVFLSNSGHEYENLGAQEALKKAVPPPDKTRFWLHLGANFAARDWHEGLFGLAPISAIDSQRYLVVSRPLLSSARALFAGMAGLENPYPSDLLSAGELTEIIAAGYPNVAGIFGLHRFHHVADDDARCIDATQVAITIAAFRRLLLAAVA